MVFVGRRRDRYENISYENISYEDISYERKIISTTLGSKKKRASHHDRGGASSVWREVQNARSE